MDRKIDPTLLKREKLRRLLRVAAIALPVAAGIVWLISSMEKTIERSSLRFATAELGVLETAVPASGRIVPAVEEIVNSPVESRILQIFVAVGDTVSEGTPLLELDLESTRTAYDKMVDEYQIRLQETRSQRYANHTLLNELAMQVKVRRMQLKGLAIDLENERKLDSIGSGTGERVRQAETALAAARLELAQLQSRHDDEQLRCEAAERVGELSLRSFERDVRLMKRTLDQGRIPAPRSGVVTFISRQLGSRIGAGEKVAVVSDLSQFSVEGEVPEGNSRNVRPGARVRIRMGNTDLYGTVESVTPQSQSGMTGFNVTLVDPRSPMLRSGVRAELYVSHGFKQEVVRLPAGPYFKGAGEGWVFVDTGSGHIERRKVVFGDSNRDYVEIVAGLRPGDSVVISDLSEISSKKSLKLK